MKTKNILIIIGFLITSSSFADNFKLKEEAYIDDIPFNTAEIAVHYMTKGNDSITISCLEMESYIDDIPFNTKQIADSALSEKAMNEKFTLVEEAYIDDIPFNTRLLAYRSLSKKSQPTSSAVLRFLIFTKR